MMARPDASARILFKPLWKKLARSPALTQDAIYLAVALLTFALVYGIDSLALGT